MYLDLFTRGSLDAVGSCQPLGIHLVGPLNPYVFGPLYQGVFGCTRLLPTRWGTPCWPFKPLCIWTSLPGGLWMHSPLAKSLGYTLSALEAPMYLDLFTRGSLDALASCQLVGAHLVGLLNPYVFGHLYQGVFGCTRLLPTPWDTPCWPLKPLCIWTSLPGGLWMQSPLANPLGYTLLAL